MIKSIKLHQTNALINQRNIDDLIYVDRVSSDDYMEIIFKKGSNNQLYSFYYYDYDMTIDTVHESTVFIDDDDDLDVKVTPVKKVTKQITVTKYIRDDSND